MGKLSFAAVIPAAGNSGRMGSQKVLLPYGNGSGFAEHLTSCFSVYGCDPVVLVVNEHFEAVIPHAENLIIVGNRHVEKGRSHSIHLGLQHVPEGSACFIHNIDNPFPESAVLSELLKAVPSDGYVVPVYLGRGGHPVLLGCGLADQLRSQRDLTDFRQALQEFTKVEVPCADEHILWNINTPDEYLRFIRHTQPKPG